MRKIAIGSEWKKTILDKGDKVFCGGKEYTVENQTRHSILAHAEDGTISLLDPREVRI